MRERRSTWIIKERRKNQQQAAEDFLQARLYGPGLCRTSEKESETNIPKKEIISFEKKI